MSRVDVIIVNYLACDCLERCLEGLYLIEGPSLGQVVVVDNSPKPPPAALRERFPWVRWLIQDKNLGFARGVNAALDVMDARFVCLLNPDSRVDAPFLARTAEWMERHEDVAALAPLVVDPDGREQGAARRFPSLSTAFFGRSSLLSRWLPDNRFTRSNVIRGTAGPVEVDWVSGACMVVRMEAVRQVGGLDTRFFIYWEDCDWCTRFRRAGWKVVYHPGLGPVIHEGGRSSSRKPLFSLYHFHRSAVLLYAKYDRSPFRVGSLLATLGAGFRMILLSALSWRGR